DSYNLLPVKVTDALNNQMSVQVVDYHTLTPQQIRDSNGNSAEALCDPLGMVVVSSYYGTENGQAVGFMPVKDYQPQAAPGIDDIIANPQKYLQGASSYFYYDLFAWDQHRTPAHTISLVATSYPASGTASPIQITIGYSDGFGRAQQGTAQVEAGQAHIINPDGTITVAMASERWLTSGRTVYNNKGNPVKQYEPYYIASYQYIDNPHLNTFGVSPTLFYDPLGRVIRVDTAKGFFSKTEITPWTETLYDENDTIKDSAYYQSNINNQAPDFQDERQALQKAALFYNTPTIRMLDNLGRVTLEIQQAETQLKTHYEWDIQGNQLASADPRLYVSGKENFRMTYTMTGVALKTVSTDAGTRWQLYNVMGNPMYSRDARNTEQRVLYDALNRPTTISVQGGDGSTPINQIVDRMIYGDGLDETGKPVVANPEMMNLRGRLYRRYDQAGVVQTSAYNIAGQPLQSSRQLRQDYKQEANWNDVSAATLNTLLQPTIYQETYQYDALSRVTAATNADGNISAAIYHLSGRLNQIQVRPQAGATPEVYVQSIDYDAKNQRQSITYGNSVTTSYEYEPTTFRLIHILTTRASDGKKLQDLTYTYDPVGNITHIVDAAQEPVFNTNQQVNPASDYTYDALYRLIAATGREHPALASQDEQQGGFNANLILPLQPLNNGQALQNYSQQFTYDDAGNLSSIQHQGATSWTRTLTVSDSANRAVDSQLTSQPTAVNASFDGNGNQIQMPVLQGIAWNYRNNIASVTVIARQNAPSDGEYYVYDGAGNRIRKVSEQYGNGGTVAHIEETIYLGALEITRITQGSNVMEERHALRVMDDERAVATRITWMQGTPPAGVTSPQLRYQLDNHLGSATLEVDAAGQIISYEEYFPYGGTALVAGSNASEVELKQYRYSGKERDTVTGFYYYGARYYAPWLGRWMSPDPSGTVDGLNLYAFVSGNPVILRDLDGRSGKGSGGQKVQDRRQYYYAKGDASRPVRRLNSLARLFDVFGSVVTAVGVGKEASRPIKVAANEKYQEFETEVKRRTEILKKYFKEGGSSTEDTLKALQSTGKNTFDDKRLRRDLRKLRAGKGVSKHVKQALRTGNIQVVRGAFVGEHAEIVIERSGTQGLIGVSKLSCKDCVEHLSTYRPTNQELRKKVLGTHGYKFPTEGECVPSELQHPDTSDDSEAEETDDESSSSDSDLAVVEETKEEETEENSKEEEPVVTTQAIVQPKKATTRSRKSRVKKPPTQGQTFSLPLLSIIAAIGILSIAIYLSGRLF
ncbi:MAG TPA: RHS repeat-associated core domain-containing protein, partial [Ktedonobacteraceae bacterium]|nr:RHS repeat-associated core domain-containing protein [Ktedonobacteraceae bacterium]